MNRKLISILLVIVMIIGLFPMAVLADEIDDANEADVIFADADAAAAERSNWIRDICSEERLLKPIMPKAPTLPGRRVIGMLPLWYTAKALQMQYIRQTTASRIS